MVLKWRWCIQMSYETRPQTYDETIKILEKKDHRGIAEFILPSVKDAEEVSLEHTQLSVPDMREMDFLTRVNMNSESFILHIEFETAYKSNTEMMKRMLRYYTYIKWHNDLPIYQVLVVLKKPENVKNIQGSFESTVQDLDILKYNYKVIKAYEIDKSEILKEGKVVLYPLRVFMKHDEIDEEKHIEECLETVESLEDKDYYFLTVECIKKLYKESKYEKYVKEEILMQSQLYKEPYEKGREEGIEEGRRKEKMDTTIRLLTKKFGTIPPEIKKSISKLDMVTLELIVDEIFEYESLEDMKKYLQ